MLRGMCPCLNEVQIKMGKKPISQPSKLKIFVWVLCFLEEGEHRLLKPRGCSMVINMEQIREGEQRVSQTARRSF